MSNIKATVRDPFWTLQLTLYVVTISMLLQLVGFFFIGFSVYQAREESAVRAQTATAQRESLLAINHQLQDCLSKDGECAKKQNEQTRAVMDELVNSYLKIERCSVQDPATVSEFNNCIADSGVTR